MVHVLSRPTIQTHFAHDDSAIDGKLQVLEGVPHECDHPLHPVNLLTQEDIHGGQSTHLLQPGLHLQSQQ